MILRYIVNLPNKFVLFGISETIGNKMGRNDKVLHCCGESEVLHLTYDLHKEDCTVWDIFIRHGYMYRLYATDLCQHALH